jgi:hypothetical protein
VVEHLPSTCKAQNLNLNTAKRKKEEERRKEGGREGGRKEGRLNALFVFLCLAYFTCIMSPRLGSMLSQITGFPSVLRM